MGVVAVVAKMYTLPEKKNFREMEVPREIQGFNELMTQEQLQKYFDEVISLLEMMKPGQRLEIARSVRPENRVLFTEIVKWYMRNNEWSGGIGFCRGMEVVRKEDMEFIKGTLHRARGGVKERISNK